MRRFPLLAFSVLCNAIPDDFDPLAVAADTAGVSAGYTANDTSLRDSQAAALTSQKPAAPVPEVLGAAQTMATAAPVDPESPVARLRRQVMLARGLRATNGWVDAVIAEGGLIVDALDDSHPDGAHLIRSLLHKRSRVSGQHPDRHMDAHVSQQLRTLYDTVIQPTTDGILRNMVMGERAQTLALSARKPTK